MISNEYCRRKPSQLKQTVLKCLQPFYVEFLLPIKMKQQKQ